VQPSRLSQQKKGKKPVGRGKSSGQDKNEGAMDKLKGRAKEAAGAVTGDEAKKFEGRSDQTKGTAKEKRVSSKTSSSSR
jgi:uncharacterized protein YjbJ (UPF0337 family)